MKTAMKKIDEKVKNLYPSGIHGTLANFLSAAGFETHTATLDQVDHGLTEEVLKETDVLIWWGHLAHDEVNEDIVQSVYEKVLQGMGLIVLHSGHFSKIFKKLMGTSCDLKWREAGEKERLWVIDPTHPIVEGIGEYIDLEQEEMYGEHFDIPTPDELVLVGWFKGGEVFRSGCTFKRGNGKIFYFQPGHETYPTYYQKDIQKILINAVNWANSPKGKYPYYGNHTAIENLNE